MYDIMYKYGNLYARDVVENINMDLYELNEKNENDFWVGLIYESNGYCEFIKYLGNVIWDSENEGFEWDDETNTYLYDKLESTIREKVNYINKKIIGKLKNI